MTKRVSWLAGALAALLLASCGGHTPPLHVPGNPDELSNVYDSVVALVQAENGELRGPYCTATFISPRLLATAAHCVPAVTRIQVAPGISIEVPAPPGTSAIGQPVQFVTYQAYNEWVGMEEDEQPNHPHVMLAMVVGVDEENDHDVALLELAPREPNAQHWLEMRNLESEPLQPGEVAYSIGMPVGQIWILTDGIISRVQIRRNNTIDILHQVRMGPGSSGSALIDSRGRIVGVNSAGWIGGRGSGTILGQAKPISYVQTMIRILESQRQLERLDRNLESRRDNA